MGVLKNLGLFLFHYKFTIVLAFCLFLISMKFEFFMYHKLAFLGSAISLIFLLHLVSKWRFHIIYSIFFSFIVTVSCYFAFVLESYLSSGIFASMMETDMLEATSMLKSLLLPGILVWILFLVLTELATRELRKGVVGLKVSAIGLGVYFFLFVPTMAYRYMEKYEGALGAEAINNPMPTAEFVSYRIAPILYANIMTMINYGYENHEFNSYKNNKNKCLLQGIEEPKIEDNNRPKRIYLIIGESATRDNMSVYRDMKYNTTPFLDSLIRNDSTASLFNGFASSTITRDSHRMTLGFASPHNMERFFTTKSIIDMANDKFFDTYWITSHNVLSEFYSKYIRLIAGTAKYLPTVTDIEDFELIQTMKSILDDDKEQFIIINLEGSHMDYRTRYDAIDAEALPDDGEIDESELHYNRTLYHTDRVLRSVYESVKQDTSAVMLYYSDHGENVGRGHGSSTGRAQVRVPIFMINRSVLNMDSIAEGYMYDIDGQRALNNISACYILAEALGYSVSEACKKDVRDESGFVLFTDKAIATYGRMREN